MRLQYATYVPAVKKDGEKERETPLDLGRALAQGTGFQSVNATITAQDQCAVSPSDYTPLDAVQPVDERIKAAYHKKYKVHLSQKDIDNAKFNLNASNDQVKNNQAVVQNIDTTTVNSSGHVENVKINITSEIPERPKARSQRFKGF